MTASRIRKGFLGGGVAAITCLASAAAWAQTLGQAASSHEVSLWRVVGALFFCCFLGAAGAFALRLRIRNKAATPRAFDAMKWQQMIATFGLKPKSGDPSAARLKLIETVRLSYQVDVNLLECDGENVVIVTSPQGAFVVKCDASTKTEGVS